MRDQFRLMRLRRTSSKLTAGAMLMLAVSGTALGLAAAPASADPGSCGVRVDSYPAGGLQYNYVVRNKCSVGYNFAVFIPSLGRRADPGCKFIGPGGTTGFWSVPADPNWYVQIC